MNCQPPHFIEERIRTQGGQVWEKQGREATGCVALDTSSNPVSLFSFSQPHPPRWKRERVESSHSAVLTRVPALCVNTPGKVQGLDHERKLSAQTPTHQSIAQFLPRLFVSC